MNQKVLLTSATALVCLIILFLIAYFSLDLSKTLKAYSYQSSERAKVESQIKTWQSITDKYKGYKDGYLQLAVLEYRLGEFEKAKNYTNQALSLDPGYKEALEFQKKLKNY